MAENLLRNTNFIIKENKKDLDKAIEKGISESMLDRLKLDEKRLELKYGRWIKASS